MPGDAVDLDVATSELFFQGLAQQIVLSRGGSVLAFAALSRYGTTSLADYGISIQMGAATCADSNCSFTHYDSQVNVGGTEAVLAPGQSALVGTLSISLGRSDVWNPTTTNGACDASNIFQVAGFDTTADPIRTDGSSQ